MTNKPNYQTFVEELAKKLGRTLELRPNWDNLKRIMMYVLLVRKFSHTHLQEMLLNTGERPLIEGNYWHDTYWGRCFCTRYQGEGSNHLERLLERIRNDIWSQA